MSDAIVQFVYNNYNSQVLGSLLSHLWRIIYTQLPAPTVCLGKPHVQPTLLPLAAQRENALEEIEAAKRERVYK